MLDGDIALAEVARLEHSSVREAPGDLQAVMPMRRYFPAISFCPKIIESMLIQRDLSTYPQQWVQHSPHRTSAFRRSVVFTNDQRVNQFIRSSLSFPRTMTARHLRPRWMPIFTAGQESPVRRAVSATDKPFSFTWMIGRRCRSGNN